MSATQHPTIDVLAVHRVPFRERELRTQLETQLEQACLATNAIRDVPGPADEFVDCYLPLVLMDVVVTNADSQFTAGGFAQKMGCFDSPQFAYDEAVFSTEDRLLERKQGCADPLHNGRIMFDLHY